MNNIFKNGLNLQLFAEGASGGEAGATGAVAQAANGMPATSDSQGVTVQDATAQQNARDLNAEFDSLVKGEYKEVFDKRMQSAIQSRLKSTKDTVAKYEAAKPLLGMIGDLYGVDSANIEGLIAAVENDNRLYDDEALERGIPVEQLKVMKRLERQNESLRRAAAQAEEQKRIENNLNQWMQEAEMAKQMFPQLDLQAELKNPRFIQLCESGVGVQNAYFALHMNELLPQAMQFSANAAQKATVNSVMANGQRPNENGLNSTAAAASAKDISKLTDEEMADLIRRANAGESIDLRHTF